MFLSILLSYPGLIQNFKVENVVLELVNLLQRPQKLLYQKSIVKLVKNAGILPSSRTAIPEIVGALL